MKKILFLLAITTSFFACENQPETTNNTATEVIDTGLDLSSYPADFQEIMGAHGGLEQWQKMRALTFELVDSLGNERTYTDLQTRYDRIGNRKFTMGYDGSEFWVKADSTYKGSPVFYHNLMFYFYAMPFVLADEGIIYSETDSMTFDGQTYPGILVGFEDGVGVASKDEYKLFYHPETYQMTWLSYTVTYGTNEKGKRWGWINYDDWQTINGVLLPKSAAWFKGENGQPKEFRKRRSFANVKLSETPLNASLFAKIDGAKVVTE